MRFLADIKFNTELQELTFCKYNLRIKGKDIVLTFPQLLYLRRKVSELTTPSKMSVIIDSENYVLLFLADREYVLFLEIPELLDLRDELLCYFSDF